MPNWIIYNIIFSFQRFGGFIIGDKELWMFTYFALQMLSSYQYTHSLYSFLFLVFNVYHMFKNIYGATEYILWEVSEKICKCL